MTAEPTFSLHVNWLGSGNSGNVRGSQMYTRLIPELNCYLGTGLENPTLNWHSPLLKPLTARMFFVSWRLTD
jgi:hypothetical protein